MSISVGDTVRAHYNSGVYIGTIKEDRGDRFLVQILAVLQHPTQGDLHHPGVADGENVFFHSRKALAHHEKTNVTKTVVYPYEETVPDYHESLKTSIAAMKEKLAQKENDFNKKALKNLTDLENNDYQKSYYQ